MTKDYYGILGLSINATADDVKKAYRILSKKWHPDMNPGRDTTAIMQDINEAYCVLSNPTARARYDAEYSKDHVDFSVDDIVIVRAIKKAKESFARYVRRILALFSHWLLDILIDGIKVGFRFLWQYACMVIITLMISALFSPSDHNGTTRAENWEPPTHKMNVEQRLNDPFFFNEKDAGNPHSIYKPIKSNNQNEQNKPKHHSINN